MPVGAYGGRREIMELVAPLGGVYQAGTLSGNPVAMAAGLAQLSILRDFPESYQKLNHMADDFFEGIRQRIAEAGLPYQVNHIGSLGCIFFTDQEVTDYDSAKTSDTAKYADYCNYMLEHGVYLAPAQFEAMFLSMAHTELQLMNTLKVMETYWKQGK